jgi:DNA-binding response OmpR family regulator
VIVDWDGADGQAGQLLKRLRGDYNNGLGVIAVVDEDDPDAALEACEMGSNEYLTRPLEESELSNRVLHLLKHRPGHPSLPEYYPPFRFDLNRRTVVYQGQVHRPRPREFDLMVHLLRRPDEVISRSQLKETVWFGESDDCRSIDTYISRIRRLYGLDGQSGWRIKSVYGKGYRLIAVEQ